MSRLVLYHGSQKIVSEPTFGEGKVYNDYGLGFYCTENKELAKEWSCPTPDDGFLNCYEIETDTLRILDLQKTDFCALHWLALLIINRRFDLDTPIMRQGVFYLKSNFLPDIYDYDVIKGYRADDSYFSFAKSFLSNQISYEQLCKAIKLGKLGEQFVLKSKKAFGLIHFSGYEISDGKKYYALRQARLQQAYADLEGLYIRDLILQEVKNGDSRLR